MKKIDLIKKSEDGREKSRYVLYLSVVLLASAGFLGVALIGSVTFAPNLPAQISEFVGEREYRDVELVFNESDIEAVNNRLDEAKEFGWCISTERLDGNRFSVDLREGENMSRSSGSVSFSCSVWETGRLHTHPGIWSVPYPSRYDREGFQTSSRRFDCVAAGRVSTVEKTIGLNCYQKSGEGLEKVAVVVE